MLVYWPTLIAYVLHVEIIKNTEVICAFGVASAHSAAECNFQLLSGLMDLLPTAFVSFISTTVGQDVLDTS